LKACGWIACEAGRMPPRKKFTWHPAAFRIVCVSGEITPARASSTGAVP
jgi:hypothetical protein